MPTKFLTLALLGLLPSLLLAAPVRVVVVPAADQKSSDVVIGAINFDTGVETILDGTPLPTTLESGSYVLRAKVAGTDTYPFVQRQDFSGPGPYVVRLPHLSTVSQAALEAAAAKKSPHRWIAAYTFVGTSALGDTSYFQGAGTSIGFGGELKFLDWLSLRADVAAVWPLGVAPLSGVMLLGSVNDILAIYPFGPWWWFGAGGTFHLGASGYVTPLDFANFATGASWEFGEGLFVGGEVGMRSPLVTLQVGYRFR